MKAVLCEQYGPPETLVVREVPDLVPGMGHDLPQALLARFADTIAANAARGR